MILYCHITQALHKLQDELQVCTEELRREQENANKLLNEKLFLEQRISKLEEKKVEEVINETEVVWVFSFGKECSLLFFVHR